MEQDARLIRARIRLLVKSPFYGALCLYLEPTPKTGMAMGTMATDGKRLFYDPNGAMVKWTDDELQTAVAHETMHAALLHLVRRGTRHPMKWNVSADFAINGLLKQDGFTLNADWLYNKKYDGMSAESIYATLPDLKQKAGGGGSGDEKPDGTLDDPTLWKEATQQGDGEAETGAGRSEVTEQEWRDRVSQAATSARMQGKLPAHLASMVDDLLHPKLDWRSVLRDFVQTSARNDYRMLPPNKRYLYRPLYMPSMHGEHLDVVCAIDTSGSIGDLLLKRFLGEVRGIAEQFTSWRVHLLACDAAVHDYWNLSSDEDGDWPTKFVFKGGRGGTSFIPVFDAIREKGIEAPCMVYLTDLYGSFPDNKPPYDVLWVTPTEGVPVPFGQVVNIMAED